MNISNQPLTNSAYGYPRGAKRRVTPYVLAVVHQTSNATANAQQERNYANRPNGDGPSATYYIDKNGDVIGAVDGQQYASWCSGDLNKPDLSIQTVARMVVDKQAGYNPNEAVWDQFECCGTGAEPWSDQQFESVATLIAARAQVTGLPIDRTTVLAHRDINTIDRASDPWPADRREARMARLIARANQILHPEAPVKITGTKASGEPIATGALGVGHLLLSCADPIGTRYGPYDAPLAVRVYAAETLRDENGAPIDCDGNQPPRNGRELVYRVDADGFGVQAYALQSDIEGYTPLAPTVVDCSQAVHDATVAEYNRVTQGTRADVKLTFPEPPK